MPALLSQRLLPLVLLVRAAPSRAVHDAPTEPVQLVVASVEALDAEHQSLLSMQRLPTDTASCSDWPAWCIAAAPDATISRPGAGPADQCGSRCSYTREWL
jgi:hypothetical protein